MMIHSKEYLQITKLKILQKILQKKVQQKIFQLICNINNLTTT